MQIATEEAQTQGSLVCFTTSQGMEHRATLLKLTHFQIAFEVCGPNCVLRTSEVLQDFTILSGHRQIYSGQAVVMSLVNIGTVVVCEAALQDSWIETGLLSADLNPEHLRSEFQVFLKRWEKLYKIRSEYKLIIADLHTFMTDMRLWLDQLELSIRSLPSGDRLQVERDTVGELARATTPALTYFFERFEQTAAQVEQEGRAAHAEFCRRQLHPLLMASPFMHRIYVKPLGYAGDYEMVNMILRDPCEGASLFAKLLNVFILSQAPAIAHRNRVSFLSKMLVQETSRAAMAGHRARIMNLGCGPAKEVQNFLADEEISNMAELELLDFDEQTLMHLKQKLEALKHQHNRRTQLNIVKRSVQQVLKQVGKAQATRQDYDLIYCAGLFDYLNDRTCKTLLASLYNSLAPGGLLVATNVEKHNPIRNIMEYLFEWHLIYRSAPEFARLAPDQSAEDAMSVKAEPSGGNIFLEVRKDRLTV
jgi:extracellular factor (EF) 3-hydroxypalmitic acid methyl ester biosynthesis protein